MKEPKIKGAPRRGGRRPGAGRPKLGVTLQRQIAKLGISPEQIDPEKILASIALDPSAPAAARVSACKALLDIRRDPARPASGPELLQPHTVQWHTRGVADA